MPNHPKHTQEAANRSVWFVPIAIVIAGALLALAVYSIHSKQTATQITGPAATLPVSTEDHLLGDPAAPVVIIEYADIDSEYAKDFEQTMEEVMQNYGPNDDVAWVFRDFPLIGQDQYSEEDAEAAECASGQGGTVAFFKFVDALQAAAPADAQYDPSGYPTIISALGLSQTQFDTCMKAHTYQKRVEADYENALAIGATGSPYSILLVRGQAPEIISGSLPYDEMKQVIDASIAKALGN